MERTSRSKCLRRVLERRPVATYQNERYCTIHIVETLECGHQNIAYPFGDPLTAKSRICATCAKVYLPIPKKPSASAFPPLVRQRKVSGE
jgi:hypothetical protein